MDARGAIECRYDRLLPFLIEYSPATEPNYVYLVSRDGLHAISLADLITVTTDTVDGVGYLYHIGAVDINQSTTVAKKIFDDVWDSDGTTTWADFVCDGGYYYLEVAFGEGDYFQSELLHIVDFPEFSEDVDSPTKTRVRFECVGNCTIAGVVSAAVNTSQKVFLNARTAQPEYPTEKLAKKDETILWAKIKKRHTVKFWAIETVLDFFATMPLYETVDFTDQYGVRSVISDIEVKATWNDDGGDCVADVEVSFIRDFVEYSGCC